MLTDELEALGMGVNPSTGEELPAFSVVHTAEGKRILFTLITELIALNSLPKKRKKRVLTKQQEVELKEKNIKEGKPARSHFPWSDDELSAIENMFNENSNMSEIAKEFERSKLAIAVQLEKLKLISIEEVEVLKS
ncbi:hypothetical protein [Thalassomonas sp. RHCl1]|uniref:hypothetical protein n=1 Tax=Thalassomonas sp. RHCl1 TaxID=2995320 RepID=UPI00248B36F9|nr:hypothetical protein [Thalassomonas sp. RHCl1]